MKRRRKGRGNGNQKEINDGEEEEETVAWQQMEEKAKVTEEHEVKEEARRRRKQAGLLTSDMVSACEKLPHRPSLHVSLKVCDRTAENAVAVKEAPPRDLKQRQ